VSLRTGPGSVLIHEVSLRTGSPLKLNLQTQSYLHVTTRSEGVHIEMDCLQVIPNRA
jgi:hypothetical protein